MLSKRRRSGKVHGYAGIFVFGIACLIAGTIFGEQATKAPPKNGEGAPIVPGVLREEFIYTEAPFPSCHASTIAETPKGLVAAWFGGTDEGSNDVGIWLSRHDGTKWSPPVEVADGVESSTKRYPCWNPVLFRMPKGELILFYKVGPSPSRWWGMAKRSADDGATWSAAERLPEGILGPVRNKPILLKDGTLLCGSSTEDNGWRAHMERTTDGGKTWTKTEPLNEAKDFGLIQPTIFMHKDGQLQILCRSRQKKIVELWSSDAGKTWSAPQPTVLPNPNSGIDGMTLADGRHLLVYNHTERGRSPINVAVSEDGKTWKAAAALETQSGEYSYPAVIQTDDGKVHITYTHRRQRIRHVVIDPTKLQLRDMPNGKWPEVER